MIKNFEEYINEDYFSKLASRKDNGIARKENEITEDFVRSFVLKPYESIIDSITIRKEIVDIDGGFCVREDIGKIPFQFGKVTGIFDCSDCEINSLKGCPAEVGKSFSCVGCKNLTSLEGCPKEVGGDFKCWDCGKKFTTEYVKSLCNVKGRILS